MPRTLVNLGAQCEGATNPCANTIPATPQYGDPGEKGIEGAPGLTGASGRNAFTTSISPFTMPPVGLLASIQVQDNRSFSVGQKIYIASVGYFEVAALIGITSMSVENLGGTSTLPAGALIGSNLRVTSGAQPGPDTPANAPKRWAYIAQTEDQGDDGGPLDNQFGTGSTASGAGSVKHITKISDPDNIVTIFGASSSTFRLAIGLWHFKIRVPAYYSRGFKAYLLEVVPGQVGIPVGSGNGYAGIDNDGADPQRHAVIDALVSVTDPEKYFQINVQHQRWSFARPEPARSRAFGVASNFDDGAATAVREIFTSIEIEEL